MTALVLYAPDPTGDERANLAIRRIVAPFADDDAARAWRAEHAPAADFDTFPLRAPEIRLRCPFDGCTDDVKSTDAGFEMSGFCCPNEDHYFQINIAQLTDDDDDEEDTTA